MSRVWDFSKYAFDKLCENLKGENCKEISIGGTTYKCSYLKYMNLYVGYKDDFKDVSYLIAFENEKDSIKLKVYAGSWGENTDIEIEIYHGYNHSKNLSLRSTTSDKIISLQLLLRELVKEFELKKAGI